MIDLEELRKFLNNADKPHADGTAKIIREEDGSSTITFSEGEWSMHDNFFGGEPYGGRQIVYFQGKPAWFCAYYGWIEQGNDVKPIYDFLRLSLQHEPVNGFSRGPASFVEGEYEYRNSATGSIENYSGDEIIMKNGKQIYVADYMGGLVDQHANGEY